MIFRARSVVTMDGAPIENGAVAIAGGDIADVGSFGEVRRRNSGDVTDLGECALLPGLINAHCHLDYTLLRRAIPRQDSFTDWIRAINQHKASLTRADYVRSINSGFAEAAAFGTTTVINFVADPGVVPFVAPAPIRAWWMAEMIDVRVPIAAAALVKRLVDAPARHPGGHGLAPHAPFTASAQLYREAAAITKRDDLLFSTHLAESRDEMQMFSDAAGPLYDFMQKIGRPMHDCGGITPLAHLLRQRVLDGDALVVHLNELSETDFALLDEAPRFHIAHCPRSSAHLEHAPFPLRRLESLGFNVCLGTDSLASNHDLSLFREMQQLQQNVPSLSAHELLAMVTTCPARALRQQNRPGRLRVGGAADMIAVPTKTAGNQLLDEVVNFTGTAALTIVAGNAV